MRISRYFITGLIGLLLALAPQPASAQSFGEMDRFDPIAGSSSASTSGSESLNPIAMLEDSADAIPGFEGGLSGALNIMVMLTVLSLVPAIMIMCTCFIRFIIVLGMLKQALGTQGLPPSQVLLALSLFMTFMVMAPTIDRIYDEAIVPYQQGEVQNQVEMWERAKQPLRDFMFAQIEEADSWSTVFMLMEYRTGEPVTEPQNLTRADVDMLTLIPAYMLSELKIAFLMGFRIYLPFLVIDMVVASLLISMSMMMLPPVLVSLPFKVLLFILVDGWALIVGSLMRSVAPVEPQTVALMEHVPLVASLGLA
ncbi:MAG: flagellar type III secretion system pore protein FliP [bacterium]|nr:flagellar type III secretion system pore protein FliP [bacterium]